MKTTLLLGLALLVVSPTVAQKSRRTQGTKKARRAGKAQKARPAPGAPGARYKITDLGTLGGEFSIANAINSRGEIAGQATNKAGQLRAVKWVAGKAIDCGAGEGSSNALDINDVGIMVGYTGKTFGPTSSAAVWSSQNTLVSFNMPDDWKAGGSAFRAINNASQIVGYGSDTQEGEAEGGAQGFLYSPDKGSLAALKSEGGNVIPGGINEAGEIVMTVSSAGGREAWKVPTKLPMEIAGDMQLLDINDRGEVAACLNGNQALLLKITGTETATILFGAGLPTRINNRGEMVGQGEGGAALFEKRGAVDLNLLIPKNSGWVLSSANGINDAGQIVGFGKFQGSDMRAFLLSPTKK